MHLRLSAVFQLAVLCLVVASTKAQQQSETTNATAPAPTNAAETTTPTKPPTVSTAVITSSSAPATVASSTPVSSTVTTASSASKSDGTTPATKAPDAAPTDKPTAASALIPPAANVQVPRDVSKGCDEMYKEMLASNDSTWVPEKVVLNLEDRAGTPLSVTGFCKQMTSISALNTVCSNVTASDPTSKTSAVVAGLSAMFASLCPSTPSLKVVTANGVRCSESLVRVTNNCTSTLKPAYSYLSEMIYSNLMTIDCKLVTDSRSCVQSELIRDAACSAEQQTALSDLIDTVIQGRCNATVAATTTTTPAAAPVVTAKPNTAAPAAAATTTGGRSSAPSLLAAQSIASTMLLLPVIVAFGF